MRNKLKTILLIIPYFGKFNNYFNLFLKSIEYNETIDFLIITDDKRKFAYPKNVKVVYSTFEKEAKRFINYFDGKTRCDTPYKLVEYKPFYGEIYKEYTKGYDFWGNCETDLILGNLRRFLTLDILEYFDKIYIHGHLSLTRNNGYVNSLLLDSPVFPNIWHWTEALNIPNVNIHYDEFNGSYPTLKLLGCKIYDCQENNGSDYDYADIDQEEWFLSLSKYNHDINFKNNEKLVFFYNKGRLICKSETGKEKEYAYMHLQKRQMDNKVINLNKFIIIPNKFIDYKKDFNLKKEFIRQNTLAMQNKDYYDKLLEKYKKMEHRAIWQPKQEAIKILKEKNIWDYDTSKKIIIIIPYFGKFNNYFDLFLESVKYNETIDFLIITDDKRKFAYPKNIKVVYSTFEKESKRITSYFSFEAKCDTPYKLCDYRPFFGEIYKKYTKNYDFFGWCDTDIILGNIRSFITTDILNNHEKIYVSGCFSLLENNETIIKDLLNAPLYTKIWHPKEAYKIGDGSVHYDEDIGLARTLLLNGYSVYNSETNIEYADMDYQKYQFCYYDFNKKVYKKDSKYIYFFNKGNLVSIDNHNNKNNILVVHLQKRIMTKETKNKDKFIIIPNSFIDYDENFNLEKEFKREDIYIKENPNYKTNLYNRVIKEGIVYDYYEDKLKVLEKLNMIDGD